MKWWRQVFCRLIFFLRETKMAIPRKQDGSLDEKLISKIYIVYDPDGKAIFVVAITAFEPETEVATTDLVNEVKNTAGIPYEESGLMEYVYYYHTQEHLLEIKKRMKLKK